MEQLIDIQTPTEKIYKDNAIWVGTFLGGPLVAGYLIAENYKAFYEFDKAKRTWIYAIIATIVVFGGAFLIPDKVKIPNQIIPLIYTIIAYFIVQHFQGQKITTHINSGGQLHSKGRTIGIGFIGLAITIIPIFGFVLLTDSSTKTVTDTKKFGIMKHEIAFDKNYISEAEVDKIANGLTITTFFDEEVTKYVYAQKVNNAYELSISIIDGIANDNQAIQPFIDLRTEVQTLFPQNKIVFKLVVDDLNTAVKTIE